MAVFGCNYQGDIAPSQVISTLEDGLAIAEEAGADIEYFSLADTMGQATPLRIECVLDEVRSRWPDTPIALHLHDTRGLAVAAVIYLPYISIWALKANKNNRHGGVHRARRLLRLRAKICRRPAREAE